MPTPTTTEPHRWLGCPTCQGTGETRGGRTCFACFGKGEVPPESLLDQHEAEAEANLALAEDHADMRREEARHAD